MDKVTIKVVGIGAVGNDVLNKMVQRKVEEVEFVGIDEDQGNLDKLNVGEKILVSENLKKEVEDVLKNTDLVFVLTEISGQKNNDIASIVSEVSKTMEILTIVVVATSIDLNEEDEEIEKLKEVSDAVITLPLKKLVEADSSATFDKIFEKRDEIFIKNVEFVANMLNKKGIVNLDLDDIRAMLKDSGTTVTAFGKGEGQDKVKLVIEQVSNCPFTKSLSKKARKIMINIVGTTDVGLSEIQEITQEIGRKFGGDGINMLWGYNMNIEVEDEIEIGVLLTDFFE